MQDILTIEECTKAIKAMKLGKSPGTYGLTVDLYRFYKQNLKITTCIKYFNFGKIFYSLVQNYT